MTDAVTQVAPRRSWRRLAFATAGFLLLPLIPQLRVILPIEQTILLLVPAVAVCALVGWRSGGRLAHALVWAGLALFMVVGPAGPDRGSFEWMARGWGLMLAAVFGVTSLLTPGQPFFSRALTSVVVAILAALMVASAGNNVGRVSGVMEQEFTRRNGDWLTSMERLSSSRSWKDLTTRSPGMQTMMEESQAQLQAMPARTSGLMPAFLALESLAALALAWAIYNRQGSVPIGPELGKLKDFRFNDQLVWGVAVGLTILLLPKFEEARGAGLNLVIFFGGIYMLRGLGVLAWMSKGRGMTFVLIAAGILAWPLLAALAAFLGLGDTWVDWRTKAKPGPA